MHGGIGRLRYEIHVAYAEVDSIAVYYFYLPSGQDWILFYNFAFHCVWKTPEGKCVDVTMCDAYADDRRLVFWHDMFWNMRIEHSFQDAFVCDAFTQ